MAIELFNKITRLIESKASTFCPQSNPNGVGEHSMPHWFIKAGSANKKFQSKAGIQSRIDYFSQLGSQKETSKDKEDGLQVLEARNLPRYHKVVFPLNSNLESHPDFINFHSPTKRFYVSFLNEKTGERKYFLDRDKESVLKDVADFKATVSEREDFNLEDYKIILSEYYPNLFSANIVVNQNGYLSIEVATGKHSQLTTGNVRLLMTLHLTNGHRLLRAQNNFRIVSDQYYQARTEAEKHISAVVKEKVFTDQILTENLRFELMMAINAALKMISVDPLSLNDDYLFSLPENFDDYLPFTSEPGYWEVIFT